jgi:hypothetical protein
VLGQRRKLWLQVSDIPKAVDIYQGSAGSLLDVGELVAVVNTHSSVRIARHDLFGYIRDGCCEAAQLNADDYGVPNGTGSE